MIPGGAWHSQRLPRFGELLTPTAQNVSHLERQADVLAGEPSRLADVQQCQAPGRVAQRRQREQRREALRHHVRVQVVLMVQPQLAILVIVLQAIGVGVGCVGGWVVGGVGWVEGI